MIHYNTSLSFLFFLITTFLNGQQTIDTIPSSKTHQLRSFTNVRIYTGLDIKLIPSNENKAIVYGDNKDEIVFSQKNGTLRIKLKVNAIFNLGYTHVELFYTDPIDLIDVNQSSKLICEDVIKQTFIQIKVNEESSLTANLDVSRVEATVSTGSSLSLIGRANTSDLTIRTGGSCKAEKLITNQSKIQIFAGGQTYVYASELLDAKITGGGILRVYGDPIKRITKKVISGKIYFMD